MMTKAEAVKWLESLKQEIGKTENRSLWHYAEAIDMVIEAMSEPKNYAEAIDMVIEAMSEPKTGEWVLKEHLWECDQCGCRINRAKPLKGNIWNYNYCPNCGADMRGERHE